MRRTAAAVTEPVETLATRLIGSYETLSGADAVFAPDALFDINVPTWRFQVRGADAFLAWLRGYAPDGYRLTLRRVEPTVAGFVVELEGEYVRYGEELYFRNLLLCAVNRGRITELTFYCTGDWDVETRARQLREAPMIKP